MLKELLIGVVGGLISAGIVTATGKYYKYGAEETIAYNIDKAQKYIWQIENKISYPEDYINIVNCAEKLHECLFVIHQNLYCLNFFNKGKKVKLIRTLLYDATIFCESILFTTVGYSGEKELESRLKKGKHRLYGKNISGHESILSIQVKFIKSLLDMDIHSAIKGMKNNGCNISEEIIEINSYRTKESMWFIQKQGITRAEFSKFLNETK